MQEIPVEYLKIVNGPNADPNSLYRLSKSFRFAFLIASGDLKRKARQKFVTILKEESDEIVLPYETAFFRANDLIFLDSSDRQLIKDHLLSRLNTPSLELLETLIGITQYLNGPETEQFVDKFVRQMAFSNDTSMIERARECLTHEHLKIPIQIKHNIVSRLNDWVPHLIKNGYEEKANEISSLIKELAVPLK